MKYNKHSQLTSIKKALPHLPPSSRIILLSSSLTALPPPNPSYLLYTTTKSVIDQTVRFLAKDLGSRGITVNAVAPGPTATEMFFEGKTEEQVKALERMNPFGRLGTPEEVAAVMGFLAEGGRRL